MFEKIKWKLKPKHRKFLEVCEIQCKNKGGLWIYTDHYEFRLDFENMKIEKYRREK